VYNYAETPTEPLKELVRTIKRFTGAKAIALPIPLWILKPLSHIVQIMLGFKNPIHPVRVKKAATPTHIVPRALQDAGFDFRFDFERSLHHWLHTAPEDFAMIKTRGAVPQRVKIVLKKGAVSSPAAAGKSSVTTRTAVVELEEEMV
jgi:hypothetical protein